MSIHDSSKPPADGNEPDRPLRRYRIQQYELHTHWYEVEAADRGEAVMQFFLRGGTAIDMDGEQGFLGPAMEHGMPIDDDPDLEEELREAGVGLDDGQLMSVRAIEVVPQEPEPAAAQSHADAC